MNARIFNLIHVLLSVLFIAGIALTFSFWSTSSTFWKDITMQFNTQLIVGVYSLGFLAILFGFVFEKATIQADKTCNQQNAQQVRSASEEGEINSLIDYDYISKELDRIVNSDGDNVTKSANALRVICDQLNAGQGILFRVSNDGGDVRMKPYASYAYAKVIPDQQEEFGLNDGLVGLAVKEDREIELNDIPSSTIKVVSGLGKSAPNALHLIPVKHLNEMKGVLELSFFTPLDKTSQKFLRDNLNKIGVLL
jgi:hypothetical protein